MAFSVKNISTRLCIFLNVLAIISLLVVGYSDFLNPQYFGWLSVAGLGFPIILIINLVFLVFWLFVSWRKAWIPLLGLILAFGPIRRYIPLNPENTPPEGALKVISYNVLMYAPWEVDKNQENPIVRFLLDSDADIICLQESGRHEIRNVNKYDVDTVFARKYPYRDEALSEKKGKDVLTLLSKYPIVRKEQIPYESEGNMSMAYVLNVKGREVLVVNNHLETTGLSKEDRAGFRQMVHGEVEQEYFKWELLDLGRKLVAATSKRAPQGKAVAEYVKQYRDKGISAIVCGDFNDSPISYTRRLVADGLTDCYVSSGNGFGWSYHQSGIRVRIDHMFCSNEWKPYSAKVDTSVTISDHYPIICWLEWQGNS